MDFKKILGVFVRSGADTGEGTKPASRTTGNKWAFDESKAKRK